MVNINIRLATRATQIWQCLKTFLIVTVKGRKTSGSKWVEARDPIKYPTLHRTGPQHSTKSNPVQNISSARLKNPGLEKRTDPIQSAGKLGSLLWKCTSTAFFYCQRQRSQIFSSVCSVAKLSSLFCDPMDFNLPGFSVHGISQARTLEWVAIPFSRGYSRSRDQTCVSALAGRFFTVEPPGKIS